MKIFIVHFNDSFLWEKNIESDQIPETVFIAEAQQVSEMASGRKASGNGSKPENKIIHTFCVRLPPSKYLFGRAPRNGSTTCKRCNVGSYQDSKGQTNCKDWPRRVVGVVRSCLVLDWQGLAINMWVLTVHSCKCRCRASWYSTQSCIDQIDWSTAISNDKCQQYI